MKLNILEYSLVDENDPIVGFIISKYESISRYEKMKERVFEGFQYDTVSRLTMMEEAKNILSMIYDGDKIKITLRLKEDVNVQNLVINIYNRYCPETKEHGKMQCSALRIYTRGRGQYLSVEYQCKHPKCRAKRLLKKYLPKVWAEAKGLLENVKFSSIPLH